MWEDQVELAEATWIAGDRRYGFQPFDDEVFKCQMEFLGFDYDEIDNHLSALKEEMKAQEDL